MSPNLRLQAALTSIIQHLLFRLNNNLNDSDVITFINLYTSGEDLSTLTDKYMNIKSSDPSPPTPMLLHKDSSGEFGSEF
jgi:hypothetical protein